MKEKNESDESVGPSPFTRAARASGHHRQPAPSGLWHRCQLLSAHARGGRRSGVRRRGASLAASGALARPTRHLSCGRDQPVGASRHGQRTGPDWRRVCDLRDWARCRHRACRPRHHRRRSELPTGATRAQDRTRPCLHQCLQNRRHCSQQRLRHVLRHGAKQLPHAGGHAGGAGGRCCARHRRRL